MHLNDRFKNDSFLSSPQTVVRAGGGQGFKCLLIVLLLFLHMMHILLVMMLRLVMLMSGRDVLVIANIKQLKFDAMTQQPIHLLYDVLVGVVGVEMQFLAVDFDILQSVVRHVKTLVTVFQLCSSPMVERGFLLRENLLVLVFYHTFRVFATVDFVGPAK